MYSTRKHLITFLVLLCMTNLIIIGLRVLGYKSFGVFFAPQLIVTLGFLNYGKAKLYRLLKQEKPGVLKQYRFAGKFSTWEWNIIKAASDLQDDFLKCIRNQVIALNFISLLMIPNLLLMLEVGSKY